MGPQNVTGAIEWTLEGAKCVLRSKFMDIALFTATAESVHSSNWAVLYG